MRRINALNLFRLSAPGMVVPLLVLICSSARAKSLSDPAGVEFFENKVRPLLVEHCYQCHSEASKKSKGGLLLDTKGGLLKGGDTGPSIVTGDPENSRIVEAVRYTDETLQMPPDGKLSAQQISELETWVRMGAPDPRGDGLAVAGTQPQSSVIDYEEARKSWPYQPPKDHAPPAVTNAAWSTQPIDQFVLAKLEAKGLAPAPPAARRTLIRRAYFDLIGLPPPAQEVDQFVSDDSPDAYSKLIDRLLGSPLYGQRWARHWLDLVRYVDTFDARFLKDPTVERPSDISEAWRYRDWVVNAFNRDLPYDQFVMQQFAGDLLPVPSAVEGPVPELTDPNNHPAVATGVFSIGEFGRGDTDKEKLLTDIADDQVDLTGRAFMGLTLSCARCHDHKFDPISTADYYSLAGIFFSTRILTDVVKNGEPTMSRTPLASPAELARRKQREDRLAELPTNIQSTQDERIIALAKDMLPHGERYVAAAREFEDRRVSGATTLASFAAERKLDALMLDRWIDFLQAGDLGLFSEAVPNYIGNNGLKAWRVSAVADTPVMFANSGSAEVVFSTIKLPPNRVAIHPSQMAGVAAAWKSPISGAVQVRGRVMDIDLRGGDGIAWELVKIAGGQTHILKSGAIPNGGTDTIGVQSELISCDMQPGEFLQLNVLPKDNYENDSTMLELEIVETDGQKRTWDVNQDVAADFLASNPHADRFGNAEVWYFRDLAVKPPVPIVAENITGADDRFAVPNGMFWAPLRNEPKAYSTETAAALDAWKSELNQLNDNPPPPIPVAHVLQEGGVENGAHPGIRDVKIHIRGSYDRLGETVPRQFPQVIAGDAQKPITEGSGRLQLAKWIASPEHPLTARVMVNRIWQHHFGEGIVRTPNNFGKLGTPPTHPELLDHLAIEFIRSGWSIKAMHRAMMLSATYMQSSHPSPQSLQADPDNQLLGRMNRRKLEAEALRDALLSVTGQLDSTPGGKAINDLSAMRRSLYLLTHRSDRSDFRTLFDGPDTSAIVEKRMDSVVAPQALFLMNHPFVLDRARQLAERSQREGGADDASKIDWLYRTLFARAAETNEVEIGKTLAARGSVGWEAYCHVLLCANEFMYVD